MNDAIVLLKKFKVESNRSKSIVKPNLIVNEKKFKIVKIYNSIVNTLRKI